MANFLTLKKVAEEKDQRLISLQEVATSNYELLESLMQGRALEDVPLGELRAAMERHFQPRKLVLAERFGLMSKVQKPGQALNECYAELQKAANTCSFETVRNHRDAMVTMVFIGSLHSLEKGKRLLKKEELTTKEALQQDEALELVDVNAPHLKEGPHVVGVGQVSQVKGSRVRQGVRQPQLGSQERKPGRRPTGDKLKCRVCGLPGHFGYECPKKEKAYCKVCKKKGHLPATCWKRVVLRAPAKSTGVRSLPVAPTVRIVR